MSVFTVIGLMIATWAMLSLMGGERQRALAECRRRIAEEPPPAPAPAEPPPPPPPPALQPLPKLPAGAKKAPIKPAAAKVR